MHHAGGIESHMEPFAGWRAGFGHTLHRECPIGFRHPERIGRQPGIAIFQHARANGFRSRCQEVHEGIVPGGRRHIVKRAQNAIRAAAADGPRIAVTVAEAGLKHPVEAPASLFDQAAVQLRVGALGVQALRETEHRINDVAGVAHALRQIAGIVPAAVDDNPLVAMNRLPIAVAHAVYTGNRHAAALHIKEIERLQNRFAPNAGGNAKWPGGSPPHSMRYQPGC